MKVKQLIKKLEAMNPESDVLITNFTNNGEDYSYHTIGMVETFSDYNDENKIYKSKNGLVSLNVDDADWPEELEDIDTSGSVVGYVDN